MQIKYESQEDDYIAFNLDYIKNNARMQRGILKTRLMGSGIILLGGALVCYMRSSADPLTIIVFLLAAVGYFFMVPRQMRGSMVRNVRRVIQKSNTLACGERTLTLEDGELHLQGENEDSRYPCSGIQKIVADTAHYYVYTGAMEALIVPFRAFDSEADKQAFYDALQAAMPAPVEA